MVCQHAQHSRSVVDIGLEGEASTYGHVDSAFKSDPGRTWFVHVTGNPACTILRFLH